MGDHRGFLWRASSLHGGRAGAALPKETNAYIRKVIAARAIERYEHSHLTTLIAVFRPALRLPAQPARLVVQFAFHVGDY